MLKICHLTSVHKADDIRIFHKECSSLAKNENFDVSLIAVNCESKRVNNVSIISVACEFKSRTERIYKASRLVYQKALEVDADVYHFHDPDLLFYGLKLHKKGKKVIYDSHEDVPRQILGKHWIPKPFRLLISKVYETFENYICKRLDFIVVSTPTIKDRFVQVNSNTESICNYPLLDENVSLPTWEERKKEICYVGGITKIRGIVELVDVLAHLDDVKLNLAGSYSPESLRDELKLKQGWEKVNEFGQVNREQIISILNTSKIGIVTLHPQENYVDSLPIKMFEYMYSGLPVIASNFPLWERIISENQCGVCVDPFDIKGIADQVNYLLSNPELSKKMGITGRQSVLEKYNWTIEEKKLISIYTSLM
jgi:glycosyltransferase involved in cell wall biosynthesis